MCEFNVVSWQTFPRRQICLFKSQLIIKPTHIIFWLSDFNLFLTVSLHSHNKKLASIFNLFIELASYTKHDRIPILEVHSSGRGQANIYFSIKNSEWEEVWEYWSVSSKLWMSQGKLPWKVGIEVMPFKWVRDPQQRTQDQVLQIRG